jgi:hypothetical protein
MHAQRSGLLFSASFSYENEIFPDASASVLQGLEFVLKDMFLWDFKQIEFIFVVDLMDKNV